MHTPLHTSLSNVNSHVANGSSYPHAVAPRSQARPAVFTGTRRSRCPSVRTAALPEWLRKTFDFGSWAPKSARIWRLQEYEVPDPVQEPQQESEVDKTIEELQIRASEMAKQEKEEKDSTSPAYASRSQDSLSSKEDSPEPTKTFEEADDSELAKALRARVEAISSGDEEDNAPANVPPIQGELAAVAGGAIEEDEEEVDPLTGEEMRELIWAKYGKAYDVSFARRDVPGKAFVCLNIMWQHLEQRSFKMTEAQYIDKVDSVAYMVNVLGQTEKVRGFLSASARSERGEPIVVSASYARAFMPTVHRYALSPPPFLLGRAGDVGNVYVNVAVAKFEESQMVPGWSCGLILG
ncbi:hypothetical protein DUNSADRAFT_18588 [Dunaliella salina]|uniref:Uncharacterized protein n=1 Tax=Dunaliella salina TaxID=3046 RepID=A0ABQ7FZV9_DUNSA|nr:hypothetical protein DUNSADRAFT_18588 [Dunaliella salina]|eukprot:KAF5827885.1 hypothetical protein DUNSADRAFT_18588 [Dunaliella salina]